MKTFKLAGLLKWYFGKTQLYRFILIPKAPNSWLKIELDLLAMLIVLNFEEARTFHDDLE